MHLDSDLMWDAWQRGGPFIGEIRANGRATVEWAWHLNEQTDTLGKHPVKKRPVRWYQRCDGVTDEMEIPNVKTVSWDRSIDTDAGECTIVMHNTKMKDNLEAQLDDNELGLPGYYTMGRGLGPDERARWKAHVPNDWAYALTPNTLIRTYEGYGGTDLSIGDAVAVGYLRKTGTWLVDRVKVSSDGIITLECRDMAKLLIEQQLYPPLVPTSMYPLRYCRYEWRTETVTTVIPGSPPGDRRTVYADSAVDRWYGPNNNLHGHRGTDSVDGNPETFALSVGNSHPSRPFCTDWWEYDCGEQMNAVWLNPWKGNYTLYVSVMEGGAWVNEGAGVIPYDAGPLYGTQPYVVDTGADIPFVAKFGVPWETAQEYILPRAYDAQKVRYTFRDHTKSQWGPWFYRCGIREAKIILSANGPSAAHSVTQTVTNRYDGNYTDYADIVKDILLWSGFWCKETLGHYDTPHVHGNIESTGAFAEECLPDDLFDKRPAIDPITELKETVGYIFWVDEEGAARFESPNWWQSGNFDEIGVHTDFIPEVDERIQLTGYAMQCSDENLRSEVIISSADPVAGLNDTVTTRYRPATANILRGMQVPAMWINGAFTSKAEQEIMAELIAMHIHFRLRQGSVEMWGNPCIQVNDQIRVLERVSSEYFIHYIRGISSEIDNQSGHYKMSLTTHWLGADTDWAITK